MADNTVLASLDQFSKVAFVDDRKIEGVSHEYVKKVRTKTPSVKSKVRSLSGGNQQLLVPSFSIPLSYLSLCCKGHYFFLSSLGYIQLSILVGVVFGFANGIFVAKLKLPPFIATLGTQMMASGIALSS